MKPRVNFNSSTISDDELLMMAFLRALADDGVEKLRCLCWIVGDVKLLPKRWCNDPKLLEAENA